MVPTVISIISLAFSSFAIICAILLLLVVNVGSKSGDTSTALTNEAVLTVSGMIILILGTWGFAVIGGLMDFIMTIIDIAIKRIRILWMPVLAMVMGIVGIVMCCTAL
ncbi:MAG: hypothetical protein IJ661_01740 [Lachnospiraceae bacterium]|nr:hypothetical protein [Lachnospiraceae bacterium]